MTDQVAAQAGQTPTPPSDLKAEGALLASLRYLKTTGAVRGFLIPDQFYSEPNGLIYRTMLDLELTGSPIDVISIANELRGKNIMERVGGSTYIGEVLGSSMYDPDNVVTYANIIVEKCRLRRSIRSLEEFARRAYTVNGQSSEYFRALLEAVTEVAKQDIVQDWPEPVDIVRDMRSPLVRIPIGAGFGNISSLDVALRGGMPAGRLLTIVGAPGASKTTLAFQIGMNLRETGTALVCVCAYDEEPRDLMTRLGRHRGLDRAAIERADAAAIDELEKIAVEREWMLLDGMLDGMLNLAIAIEALVRRARKAGLTPVLVLDSIQRAYVIGCEEAESEKVRVLLIIACLKAAKKMGVLCIATSEANRGLYRNKGRNGEANLLAVGKESGAIEYQSDAMLVLQRCESDEPDVEGMIVGTFPKNRIGLDDKKELWFTLDKERSLLFDADTPTSDEPPGKKSKADPAAAVQKCAIAVERFVSENPGCTSKFVQANVKGWGKDTINAAIEAAVRNGRIVNRPEGTRGTKWYVTN